MANTNKSCQLQTNKSELKQVEVYCPDDVLLAPGPLYGDVEGIAERLGDYLQKCDAKHEMCCFACGLPNCDCVYCLHISQGKSYHAQGKHSCYITGGLVVGLPFGSCRLVIGSFWFAFREIRLVFNLVSASSSDRFSQPLRRFSIHFSARWSACFSYVFGFAQQCFPKLLSASFRFASRVAFTLAFHGRWSSNKEIWPDG